MARIESLGQSQLGWMVLAVGILVSVLFFQSPKVKRLEQDPVWDPSGSQVQLESFDTIDSRTSSISDPTDLSRPDPLRNASKTTWQIDPGIPLWRANRDSVIGDVLENRSIPQELPRQYPGDLKPLAPLPSYHVESSNPQPVEDGSTAIRSPSPLRKLPPDTRVPLTPLEQRIGSNQRSQSSALPSLESFPDQGFDSRKTFDSMSSNARPSDLNAPQLMEPSGARSVHYRVSGNRESNESKPNRKSPSDTRVPQFITPPK